MADLLNPRYVLFQSLEQADNLASVMEKQAIQWAGEVKETTPYTEVIQALDMAFTMRLKVTFLAKDLMILLESEGPSTQSKTDKEELLN